MILVTRFATAQSLACKWKMGLVIFRYKLLKLKF